MASIPLESSHIKRFTPALFADIEGAPAFQLKAGSRRDRLRHQRAHRIGFDLEDMAREFQRALAGLRRALPL